MVGTARARRRREATMDVLVTGVYRSKNVAVLQRLLTGLPAHWRTAWWALDAVHPSLADTTVGSGTGGKFELLNRTIALADADGSDAQAIVLVDDDVWLTRGSLSRLVELTRRAGLGLSQPAHGRTSKSTYPFNRRRWFAMVRETTFVEIGPIIVIDGRWRDELLPFPDGIGMGWGLELLWRRRRQDGLRMGIVDAVTVQHPDLPNATYLDTAAPEFARVDALLAEDGLHNIADAQQTVSVWPRWRRDPPHGWRP
jgi:hypothetical protein